MEELRAKRKEFDDFEKKKEAEEKNKNAKGGSRKGS